MVENALSAEDIRRLYERHGPALVAYACGYCLSAASAEDAVHTVFHRLLRGFTAMPRQPVSYLYRAVRNAALNMRRDTARETPIEECCFVHRGGNREAALTLQKALAGLPEEQREVVIMCVWGGLTFEEVAAATGVPPNTAASRYRYALEKLRERMSPFQTDRDEKDER